MLPMGHDGKDGVIHPIKCELFLITKQISRIIKALFTVQQLLQNSTVSKRRASVKDLKFQSSGQKKSAVTNSDEQPDKQEKSGPKEFV